MRRGLQVIVALTLAHGCGGERAPSTSAQGKAPGPPSVHTDPAPAEVGPADAMPTRPARPAQLRNAASKAFTTRVERQAAAFPRWFFLQATEAGRGVALTFDGCHGRTNTEKVLDILAAAEVQATFFLIGEPAKRRPDLVRDIHERGHAIGGHGYTHIYLDKLEAKAAYEDQLLATMDVFEKILGEKPRYYRPPYGAVTDEQIAYFAERGFATVNWSVDSLDWRRESRSPESITRAVIDNIHDGAIVLFHCVGAEKGTIPALAGIIAELNKRGHALRTIPDLLALEQRE